MAWSSAYPERILGLRLRDLDDGRVGTTWAAQDNQDRKVVVDGILSALG